MLTSIAIGFSQADDPQEAAIEAAGMVKNQLKSLTVDMVLVFVSVHYAKKEVLDAIHIILKPTRLVGASSAGLILSHTIATRGLAIVGINSKGLTFGAGSLIYKPGQEFRQFGMELNRNILADYRSPMTKQASVFFCDSLLHYDNEFILGAQEIIGQACPFVGGFACDDFKFKRTYQIHQQRLLSKSAVGFLIGSFDSSIAISNKHGFKPLGKPRMITSAEGRAIRTIDGKPAKEIYDEFFKEGTENFRKGFLHSPGVLYPLGIYLEDQRQYLIRYPVDILSDGSIVCQTSVPSNAEVHLMINNKDSCRRAAIDAALEIKRELSGRPPKLVIVFESIIRHKILGRHLFTEVQAVKEVLGPSTPIVGMYSFGEVCHLGLRGFNTTYLQNGSILLLAIG